MQIQISIIIVSYNKPLASAGSMVTSLLCCVCTQKPVLTRGFYMLDKWLNTIQQMDCLEGMRQLPDKCIDLVLTDPPYGLDKKLFQGGSRNGNWAMSKYKGSEWDVVPSEECFREIFRVSRNQIIFGGNYFVLPPTRGIICWDKVQAAPNFSQWEMAWTSFDRPAKLFSHTFQFDKQHPTQKPIELIKWILANYSIETDLILDPFMGSGTTARACKDLGRNFIGFELEPKYVEIANKRLQQEILF